MRKTKIIVLLICLVFTLQSCSLGSLTNSLGASLNKLTGEKKEKTDEINEEKKLKEVKNKAKLISSKKENDYLNYNFGSFLVELKPGAKSINSLGNSTLHTDISLFKQESLLPTIQTLKANNNNTEKDKMILELSKKNGLDNLYKIEIKNLIKKAEEFKYLFNKEVKKQIQLKEQTVSHKNNEPLKIEVNTKDFGRLVTLIDKNNPKQQIIDPYTFEVLESLKKDESVVSIVPNFKVNTTNTNDPLFNEQWALNNEGQEFHYTSTELTVGSQNEDINFKEANLNRDNKNGVGVIVGVIDTGLDYTHPDIENNVWVNQGEISEEVKKLLSNNLDIEVTSTLILKYLRVNNLDLNEDGEINLKDAYKWTLLMDVQDNDQNGYVDDIFGYDFVKYEISEDGENYDIQIDEVLNQLNDIKKNTDSLREEIYEINGNLNIDQYLNYEGRILSYLINEVQLFQDKKDIIAKSDYAQRDLIWEATLNIQDIIWGSLTLIDTKIDDDLREEYFYNLQNEVNIYSDKKFDVLYQAFYEIGGKDNNVYDTYGHGTHVSGIIAAEANNNIGITGVAPEAKIMSIRGLGSYGGYLEDLVEGIFYAVNNGANITNNSWGGYGSYEPLTNAFNYAKDMGVISIAAAGNSDVDMKDFLPANIESVISVGAFNPWGGKAYFSNFGGGLDTSAPGEYIISLLSKDSEFSDYSDLIYNDKYLIISGTSMAAPHIAGILAALRSSRNNALNFESAQNYLKLNTKDNDENSHFYKEYGYGRIDLEKIIINKNRDYNFINLNTPTLDEHIYGSYNVIGSVNGDYNNYRVDIADASIGSITTEPLNICLGNLFDNCEFNTIQESLKEDNEYTIEINTFDNENMLVGREARVVTIDNLDISVENTKRIYGKNDKLDISYNIHTNQEIYDSFTYEIFLKPVNREANKIIIKQGTGIEDIVDQSFEYELNNLEINDKYELVLNVLYNSVSSLESLQIEQVENIYVDLGLFDNFPVNEENNIEYSTNINPVNVLDLDKNTNEQELYSDKLSCDNIGGGWIRCLIQSRIIQVTSNGEVSDISRKVGILENIDNVINSVVGTVSTHDDHLKYKVQRIVHEGEDWISANGNIVDLNSTESQNWKVELPESLDYSQTNNISIFDNLLFINNWKNEYSSNKWSYLSKNYIFDENGLANGEFITHQGVTGASNSLVPVIANTITGNFDNDYDSTEIANLNIWGFCEDNSCNYYPSIKSDVEIYDSRGALLSTISIPFSQNENGIEYLNFIENGPYSTDVNGDGMDEIILARRKLQLDNYTGSNRWVIIDIYNNNGELIRSIESQDSYWQGGYPSLVLGDINDDGTPDAILANGIYYSAYSLGTGEVIFSKNLEDDYENSHIYINKIMVADIDNDGNQNIILGTSDRWGNGKYGGKLDYQIQLLDQNGEIIENNDFPKTYSNSLEIDFGYQMMINDIDKNGENELIFQMSEGWDGKNNQYVITKIGGNPESIQNDGSYNLNQQRNGNFDLPVKENKVANGKENVAVKEYPVIQSVKAEEKEMSIWDKFLNFFDIKS